MNDCHLNMINIVPVFLDHVDFAISEIIRQSKDAGLTKFALSLSYHPEGTPAANKIPQLCNALRQVKAAVAGKGIELGALIQSTQGHGWNGKVPLTEEPWQQIINLNGSKSPRMCPLDPGFRAYVKQAVAETVRAGAEFLLVDDDFGMRINECFCPFHVAKFNAMAGTDYTADELRKEMETRPWDDPLAKLHSQMRFDTAIEFATDIRTAIDSVDPRIRCGLCTPWAGHTFVGPSALVLAGKTEPFIRINNAIYGMQNILGYYYLMQGTHRVKYQAPGVKDFIDEADTFPQNYYSESAAAFHAHVTNAILNGLNGCKLWTSEFDKPVHTGSQRRYETYLKKYRPFYEELYRNVKDIRWTGVAGQLFHAKWGMHVQKAGGALNTPDWCTEVLGPYAFPIRYAEPGQGGIYSITADDLPHLDDDAIRTLMAGKLLIDSTAAKELTKRGFSKWMGVEAGDGDINFHFAKERHCVTGISLGYMWEDMAAELKPLYPFVKVITELCQGASRTEQYTVIAPGETVFENELGGRIAVTAWSPKMPFYKTTRPQRRIWLSELLDLLNGSPLEMSVEKADQQILVRHGICSDSSELVSVQNLALDTLDAIEMRLLRAPVSVERLTADGKWAPVAFERTTGELVTLKMPLVVCLPEIFRFKF